MKVVISHAAHMDWVILPPGESPEVGEAALPLHPDRPDVVRVRRLQREPQATTIEIPEPSVESMVADRHSILRASGATDSETPTQRHRHDALAKHIEDVVGGHHSPTDHWTNIEVEGDPELEAHLRRRFLEVE